MGDGSEKALYSQFNQNFNNFNTYSRLGLVSINIVIYIRLKLLIIGVHPSLPESVHLVVNRMIYYPLVQAVSRGVISWYQLSYNSSFINIYTTDVNEIISLWFYGFFAASTGIGYFIIFIIKQPNAYIILTKKIHKVRNWVCCFRQTNSNQLFRNKKIQPLKDELHESKIIIQPEVHHNNNLIIINNTNNNNNNNNNNLDLSYDNHEVNYLQSVVDLEWKNDYNNIGESKVSKKVISSLFVNISTKHDNNVNVFAIHPFSYQNSELNNC